MRRYLVQYNMMWRRIFYNLFILLSVASDEWDRGVAIKMNSITYNELSYNQILELFLLYRG